MSKLFDRELDGLHEDLVRMADLVESAINKAIQALEQRDSNLANEVVQGDDSIDGLENEIDEHCFLMIARYQPVASDLRRMISSTMIATDLERMGDLARSIAERSICLLSYPAIPISNKLAEMADRTQEMVRQAIEAFINRDAAFARKVCQADDVVDSLNDELILEVTSAMRTNVSFIESGLSLFSVIRHLERIADHATNIAEDVIYYVEGDIVRHRKEAIYA
jgi:phosphate transport system protein